MSYRSSAAAPRIVAACSWSGKVSAKRSELVTVSRRAVSLLCLVDDLQMLAMRVDGRVACGGSTIMLRVVVGRALVLARCAAKSWFSSCRSAS